VVAIDHKACIAYGPECKEVCVEKCPRKIFRIYPSAAEQVRAVAAS
jgi:electron transport complex protein RnfB